MWGLNLGYVSGAFLRLTPVTEKQFEQATLTLVFTKAAVDKSAISDKTGQLKFCHSTGRINDSNIKFVVYRQELKKSLHNFK